MILSKQPFSLVRRTAVEVKNYRRVRRLIPVLIGVLLALLALVYIIALLFSRYGSFTVAVQDYLDRQGAGYALSLSDKSDFLHPVSYLNTAAVKEITNIEGKKLPTTLNDEDGSHNGENYMAYTFYLKNTGTKECDYEYNLTISKKTHALDDAIRVRVYYNPRFYDTDKPDEYYYDNSYVDYAKPASGGGGAPEVDPDNRVMTNFFNGNTVMRGQTEHFKPGDMAKITVVIWIEGWDPECLDDKLGGEFKLDMTFTILDVDNDNTEGPENSPAPTDADADVASGQ